MPIRDPFPVNLNSIHQVSTRYCTIDRFKIFNKRSSLCRYTKALALVLAAACSSDLSITFPEDGIIITTIQFKLVVGLGICAAKIKRVPKQSFCLPYRYSLL